MVLIEVAVVSPADDSEVTSEVLSLEVSSTLDSVLASVVVVGTSSVVFPASVVGFTSLLALEVGASTAVVSSVLGDPPEPPRSICFPSSEYRQHSIHRRATIRTSAKLICPSHSPSFLIGASLVSALHKVALQRRHCAEAEIVRRLFASRGWTVSDESLEAVNLLRREY